MPNGPQSHDWDQDADVNADIAEVARRADARRQQLDEEAAQAARDQAEKQEK